MTKLTVSFILFGIILAVSQIFAWQWWKKQQAVLAVDIAAGNGRIEAGQVDITIKLRVA